MREIMAAPIVPDTWPSLWTVVHGGGEPLPGLRECYAFTSRAALNQWAATREDGWRWLSLAETPNQYAIVLDEAWPLKYSEPVPEMCSAEDGRRVLEMLLRGKATKAQSEFRGHELPFRGESPDDGAGVLYGVYLLREWYAEYVALDPMNWTANGEITADGELAAQIPQGFYYVASPDRVIAVGYGGDRSRSRSYGYVGPVMVIETRDTDDLWQRNPGPRTTEPPLYLRLLA